MFRLAVVASMVAVLAACTPAPVSSSPGVIPGAQHGAPPNPVQAGSSPGVEHYHATELRPGDCIDPMPVDFMVTVVPCDRPHVAEFATTYVIADGPWPGTGDMRRLTENGCTPRMRIMKERKDEVLVSGLVPTIEGWPRYRTIYCLAVAPQGEHLVGRVIE
ncbi:hypothetical protein AB0J35_23800 [Nonomuraea angiospora]|uniref:hypothetical protein n=1 Tax=Nonomuraea angiospora TaxID=46172 RepID=UPI003438635E